MSDYITDKHILMAVWVIRQLAIFQSQSSVWKVVKLRLEVLQSDAELLTEISVIINRIGLFVYAILYNYLLFLVQETLETFSVIVMKSVFLQLLRSLL
jgi:hypothetical protein